MTTIFEEELSSRKALKKKIQQCLEIVQMRPSDISAREALIRSLFYTRNFDKAMEECYRLLQIAPESSTAYWIIGNVLSLRGQYSEGEKMLRKALELDASFYQAYIDLGANLHYQGRFEESKSTIRKGLELQPNYWRAHLNLSISYLMQKKVQECYQEARLAWMARKSIITLIHIIMCYDAAHKQWTLWLAYGCALAAFVAPGILTLPLLILSTFRLSVTAFALIRSNQPARGYLTLIFLLALIVSFATRFQ